MGKGIVFFVTLLAFMSRIGLIGSYAAIKYSIGKDLHVGEGFLGILDACFFLARFLSSIYIFLTPLKKPKQMYLATSSFLLIVCLPILLSIEHVGPFQKLFLILTRIAHGWIQSYIIVPYLLLASSFDTDNLDDRCKIHLWYGFGTVGDGIGLLAAQGMVDKLNISWNFAFLICVGFTWLLTIGQYVIIEEVNIQNEQHEDKLAYIREVKNDLLLFLEKKINKLWLVDAIVTENFYFNLMFWIPYYFSKIGYGFESSVISLMFPVTMALGSIVFEQLSRLCDSTMNFIVGGFYIIIFLINLSFMFMGSERQLIPIYIVLLGLIGFLLVPGYSRTDSSDPIILSQGNPRINYLIMILYKALDQILLVIMFIVIGILMEKNLKVLFVLFLLLNGLMIWVNLWRRIEERRQSKVQVESSDDDF